MRNTDPIIVRGIVVPDRWDETGTVLSVAIATYREEIYRIIDDHIGTTLKAWLRMPICATGERCGPDHSPALCIHAFWPDDNAPGTKSFPERS